MLHCFENDISNQICFFSCRIFFSSPPFQPWHLLINWMSNAIDIFLLLWLVLLYVLTFCSIHAGSETVRKHIFFPKRRMGMGSNRDRFSLSNQSTRPVTPYSLLLVTKPFDNNVWERYIYINIIYHPIKCISVTEATRKKILINFGSSKSNPRRI